MFERNIFTEEQNFFRETASKFIEKEIRPFHEKWEQNGIVPKDLWLKAGEVGLLCPNVPKKYGGIGGDFRFNVIIIEELAKVGATGPGFAVHSDIVAPYIVNYSSEKQKNSYLPKMVKGEMITAIAMTEPNTGSDLQNIRTKAIIKENKIILSGSKTFITNGQNANLILVIAKTDLKKKAKGISIILCEDYRKGFKRGRNLKKIGMKAQDTSELYFEDIELPLDNILGNSGHGFFQLMDELPQERLSIAVTAISAAESALNWTISYTKDRKAFDKKIIDFQNTKFILAKLKAEITVARTYIDKCIGEHIQNNFSAEDGAIAKLWCTDLQFKVMDECLQLFGGYGYMQEYPIAKAFLDSRVQRIYGGTNEIMKEIISRKL
ncbi:MAG: Acyl-CoA dehydrogenase, short-chain specific [Alphaproteobacteria bacterium MarineAlpha9_Bin4]|nr:acyl-CoA dehydrogenase [Pelagibacterales bacterium]PPR26228.1 MAG: Acyl-CoA dehydrogenase, short-chain specific [Alphaproteobacteria bacterium MarineAlpha9_Bin4]|tara:strand:- start:2783 stop:3919 length:1137 start_codon:yes stop_codon:yes gene_type:complete